MNDWRNRAECVGADPEEFYPVTQTATAEIIDADAKARAKDTIAMFCHHCPVSRECAQEAVKTHARDGIWGVSRECAQEAVKTHARDGIWGGVLLYQTRDGETMSHLSRPSREGLNKALAR